MIHNVILGLYMLAAFTLGIITGGALAESDKIPPYPYKLEQFRGLNKIKPKPARTHELKD
jgi:hypothetical protein